MRLAAKEPSLQAFLGSLVVDCEDEERCGGKASGGGGKGLGSGSSGPGWGAEGRPGRALDPCCFDGMLRWGWWRLRWVAKRVPGW